MTSPYPLWPARPHHVRITSDQPAVLLDFYQRVLEPDISEVGDGPWRRGNGSTKPIPSIFGGLHGCANDP